MRLALAAGVGLMVGCGEQARIPNLPYGPGQPGEVLPEGGEIRHENVRMSGWPEQTWLHVYQYKGPSIAANAPFPAPEPGHGYGNCVDEREPSRSTWPFTPITGATYLELPRVQISGTGMHEPIDVAKTNPSAQLGNSTYRRHDFVYGGGAPGNPPSGFNGSLGASASTPGGTYTIDLGVGDPITYFIPESYIAPLGIGGAETITIVANEDLTLDWTAPANDNRAYTEEPTPISHVNFTLFVDPTAEFPPQFICFPDVEGHQVIPATVIDELPETGLIVHANTAHYLDARDAAGESRRFDVVATFMNISAYERRMVP